MNIKIQVMLRHKTGAKLITELKSVEDHSPFAQVIGIIHSVSDSQTPKNIEKKVHGMKLVKFSLDASGI